MMIALSVVVLGLATLAGARVDEQVPVTQASAQQREAAVAQAVSVPASTRADLDTTTAPCDDDLGLRWRDWRSGRRRHSRSRRQPLG